MTKKRQGYECTQCGYRTAKWQGQCQDCKSWNSFEEYSINKHSNQISLTRPITQVTSHIDHFTLELGDTGKVFGCGLMVGSLSLLAGEPGVGKSTFLIELCKTLIKENKIKTILYVSGEESEAQISSRAKRLRHNEGGLSILSTGLWQNILETVIVKKPDIVIIDSLQTIRDDDLPSQAGSPNQLRAITSEIIHHFKGAGITTILVGHVTKEGSIAGPKHVEHMVDSVFTLTKNQKEVRILKANKNRFGTVNEEAYFQMKEDGLRPLMAADYYPSVRTDEYGVAYLVSRKGTTLNLIEIQALVIENKYNQGKRICQNIELNKLHLILAVLEKELKIPLSTFDVFIKASDEARSEGCFPDLAIATSILSSFHQSVLKNPFAMIGEVRLGGNISLIAPSSDYEAFGNKFGVHGGFSYENVSSIKELNEMIKDRAS